MKCPAPTTGAYQYTPLLMRRHTDKAVTRHRSERGKTLHERISRLRTHRQHQVPSSRSISHSLQTQLPNHRQLRWVPCCRGRQRVKVALSSTDCTQQCNLYAHVVHSFAAESLPQLCCLWNTPYSISIKDVGHLLNHAQQRQPVKSELNAVLLQQTLHHSTYITTP